MEDPSITASRDLFRRLPPHRVSENLALLVSFRPELADELSSVVDQPLTIAIDATNGKEYLVRQRAISLVLELMRSRRRLIITRTVTRSGELA